MIYAATRRVLCALHTPKCVYGWGLRLIRGKKAKKNGKEKKGKGTEKGRKRNGRNKGE